MTTNREKCDKTARDERAGIGRRSVRDYAVSRSQERTRGQANAAASRGTFFKTTADFPQVRAGAV